MGETAQQPTATAAREALPKVASLATTEERLARMWSMSSQQRIAAAQRGEFTLGEMLRWASRCPNEVPLVDGEFFFITAHSADAAAAEQDEMPPHTITGEQFWGGALHPLPRTATPTGRQR